MTQSYDPVLRLRCDGCRTRWIPIAQLGGPQAVTHDGRRPHGQRVRCRFVVTPDPFTGEPEWTTVLPGVLVEEVLRKMRIEWDREWSTKLLEALAS